MACGGDAVVHLEPARSRTLILRAVLVARLARV